MTDHEITQEIKSKVNIIEEMAQYVSLKKYQTNIGNVDAHFISEKTASFHVLAAKGIWRCFGCTKSGDIFTFLQKVTGQNFYTVKKNLAEKYNVIIDGIEITEEEKQSQIYIQRQYSILKSASDYYIKTLKSAAGENARKYLEDRKLSQETLEKFSIGLAPNKWDGLYKHLLKQEYTVKEMCEAGLLVEKSDDQGNVTKYYDRFRNRIMFPIWDDIGKVIAFGGRTLDPQDDAKYINSPEGPLFKKSKVLYAWNLARKEIICNSAMLILTEGYMDAIALHEAGFHATAAILGTSLTRDNIVAIDRMAPDKVYLCYDGDSAGMKAVLRATELFSKYEIDVRVIVLPEGYDPDSFIRDNGSHAFSIIRSQAPSLPQYRLNVLLGEYDLSNPSERAQSIIAAKEVLNALHSATEKAGYISWMAQEFAKIDNNLTTSNISNIERNLKKDLGISNYTSNSFGSSLPNKERKSGVIQAEEYLISVMLRDSSQREYIINALSDNNWQSPEHQEIVSVISDSLGDDSDDITLILDLLSEDSQELVNQLLFSEQEYTDVHIKSWVNKVLSHNKTEQRGKLAESLKARIRNGENITSEDFARLAVK